MVAFASPGQCLDAVDFLGLFKASGLNVGQKWMPGALIYDYNQTR